jgi:hypothetical protein
MAELRQNASVKMNLQYKNTIFSKFLGSQEVWDDLRALIERCKKHGVKEVEISIGYAWDRYIKYPARRLAPEKIIDEIEMLESKTSGRFGEDDLTVRFQNPAFEILYCHDNDIHLFYNDINPIVEETVAYWEKLGRKGAEVKNDKGGEK